MAFALWWQALAALFFIAASAFPASAQAQAALDAGAFRTAEALAFLRFFLGGKRGRFVQPS